MAGLNIRQRKFCRAYLTHKCNSIKALRVAGYHVINNNAARQQAFRLFQIPEVGEYYNGLVRKMEEKEGITLDYLFKKLKRTVDVCIPDDVALNEVLRDSASSGIKAISEINKMQGNYAPIKAENTNNTKIEIEDVQSLIKQFEKEI